MTLGNGFQIGFETMLYSVTAMPFMLFILALVHDGVRSVPWEMRMAGAKIGKWVLLSKNAN